MASESRVTRRECLAARFRGLAAELRAGGVTSVRARSLAGPPEAPR